MTWWIVKHFTIAGRWYISKTGGDSRDCGRDRWSACGTFTQLWRHFVEDKIWSNYITTDTDLFIADMHLHSPGQWVYVQNRASRVINITITNTTIKETRLWSTGNNIHIHIENSFIRSSEIESWSNPIVFRNCSFYGDTKLDNTATSLQTSYEPVCLSFTYTVVEFYNCNFTTTPEWFDRIIFCYSSNITMMNVKVRDNDGRFMETENCNVQIRDSHFRNNKARELLSYKSSNINMMNVTVRDNEGYFMKTEECSIQIVHRELKNNKGSELFSDRSNITIMNMIVRGNEGRFMSTKGCSIQITHSYFTNVTVRDNDGYFMETRECNVQITDSNFGNNKGLELFSCSSNITMINVAIRNNEGRFLTTLGSNVQVRDSDFRNNYGSELFWAYQRSNVHVINSTFTGNQGLNHGTLTIESSHLTTVGCQFLANAAKAKGSAICVRDGTYSDQDSLFADNIAGVRGKKL